MMDTTTTTAVDRDGNALGGLFQNIIVDLRNGANNWDDLLLKANKFHLQLKSTISSSTAFLDAFQKIADMATTTRGGTKEIGSALTRLCLRNRSVEAKLKSLTSSLFDSFISPLQDRVDEWKKIISQIDKEHSKEIKRLKQFRKKHSSEMRVTSAFANNTFRMRKHLPRGKLKNDFPRIGSMYDVDKIIESVDCNNKEKYFMLEEVEKNYVRRALIEERIHYCLFFNLLRPVIEEEISMLQEIIHLEEILTTLTSLTNDPHKLPTSSENFLHSLQLNDSIVPILDSTYSEYGSHHHNHHSRKSSISSMDSLNTLSTDSVSFRNVKSLSQPNIIPGFRPKSIASQDSGFLSHDYNIPNIGRLVIYNGVNKINKDSTTADKDRICMLNGKSIRCLSTIESNDEKEIKEKVEYATSAPLYHSNTACPQPIYVNIHDACDRTRFTSEGSLTPTNHDINPIENSNYSKYYNTVNNSNNLQQQQQQTNVESNHKCTKPKPIPPKPPMRHSSKLSTNTANNSLQFMTSETSKRSTLIFVKNTDNPDFPPPPPEAFIRPAEQCEKVADNLCCLYSVPSRNLVFCDNKECLQDYNRQTYRTPIYHSTSLNAFSMDSNQSSSSISQQEYHKNHDDNGCHDSQYDNHHHYQSSINLSSKHH